MDSIFENQYIRDRAVIKELYAHWFFKRPLMIVLHAILVFFFALSLVDYLWTATASAVLILVPFVFLMQFIGYYNSINVSVKRDEELYNGMLVQAHYTVTEDTVIARNAGKEPIELSLSKFKHVMVTKNLIVMMTEAKMVYTFRKDSFTKGSSEKFIGFLKQKGLLR